MNEELNKALEQISDDHLSEAANQRSRFPWLRSIAAVLALILCWSAVWAAFDFKRPIIAPEPDGPMLQVPTLLTPTVPTMLDPTDPANRPEDVIPPNDPPDAPSPTIPPSVTPPDGPGEDTPVPPQDTPSGPSVIIPASPLVAQPTYPLMVQHPGGDIDPFSSKYETLLDQWQQGKRQQYNQPQGYADNLTEFWSRSMEQFLSGEGNRAYSPANVYMALAMLAEATGSNTRQQILDLLGANSIEELRTQAGYLWNAQYCDDGETTSVLANSLWLDNSYNYTEAIVQQLTDSYYASVYNGDLGSDEMNELLKDWINSQTGGLLEDCTDTLNMEPQTVFALCSTLCYTAGWSNSFDESRTYDEIFHGTAGDVSVGFLHDTLYSGTYYWGSNFGAIRLELTKGYMWLILPDEGYTVDDILKDDEYLTMALDPDQWKSQKELIINLSLPKFDITSQSDLVEGLKELGITDVFTSGQADFSPMTNAYTPFVSQIDHAVRVAIDNEGVMAASYTVIMVAPGSPPPPEDEMDFTLDRPFLFMVTDDVPLFAGVVEQP